MVCYAEKQKKPFWFSSLDQIVHFDAIIFCRTFVELFWSVRVDRKKKSHYNSRVSLHEAPTKNDIQNFTMLFNECILYLFTNTVYVNNRSVLIVNKNANILPLLIGNSRALEITVHSVNKIVPH